MSYRVNKEVKPIRQPLRRIPINLEERVKQEIDKLESMGIIERCEDGEWISAMVVCLKKGNKIRLCLDLRQVNRAILKEDFPIPTIEELLSRVKGSKIFSTIDLTMAFHQVEVDEESSKLTTFITPWGLFRYKRLVFGIHTATETFQRIMKTIVFKDCEGVETFIDDIMVHASNEEMMEIRMKKVMKKVEDFNICLNKEKCILNAKEINYMGLIISGEGIKLAQDKLEAIRNLTAPKSIPEVRSVLGFFNFMKKFVPDMSTSTEPMNNLLRKNKIFEWKEEHEKTFQEIKRRLLERRILSHFDKKAKTEIITDASPVGLAAILMQRKGGQRTIIACASRSLSNAERKYAQPEKEALAIVWAVERFHFYVYGNKFTIITDAKPMVFIFGNKSKPCLRIERWVLRLQSYEYEIEHLPGKWNIADAFSRLCKNEPEKDSFDEISELQVANLVQDPIYKAISRKELWEATQNDELLCKVKQSMLNDLWPKELKQYEIIKEELAQVEGIIVKGTKLIIPKKLRGKVLALAHELHNKEPTMKVLIRQKMWWPGVDKDIKEHIESCRDCIRLTFPVRKEPMIRRALPQAPWKEIAIDLTGPIDGKNILMVVDYYSRFTIPHTLHNTQTGEIIKELKKDFGLFGIPQSITADNGAQFAGSEFKEFTTNRDIKLNLVAPYSPWQNGLVERMNRPLKEFIRATKLEGKNWADMLDDYTLIRNTSVNATTGKTPAELFFGRKIRNKLPDIEMFKEDDIIMEDDLEVHDKLMKERGKCTSDKKNKARRHEIEEGDTVILQKQFKESKLDPNYFGNEHEVIQRKGTELILKIKENDKLIRRNAIHVKKIPKDTFIETDETDMSCAQGEEQQEEGPEEMPNKRNHKMPAKYKDFITAYE